MSTCTTCSAKFGLKFNKLLCSRCHKPYCGGHLVLSENASFHSKLMSTFNGGQGLCLDCILQVWCKTDEDLKEPKGILGRAKKNLGLARGSLSTIVLRNPNRNELVKLYDSTFESLNYSRALAVFRHQADISKDFIIKDLTVFARVYAVSQGRSTEKSFNLKDIYQLVDWMRSHPKIPEWAKGVTWGVIESSPAYFSHISDIWHVAQTAIALSNPATATASLAYHVSDRVFDQTLGKGLFSASYGSVKDKLGLNLNLKMALLSYFGGQFVLQLLKRR